MIHAYIFYWWVPDEKRFEITDLSGKVLLLENNEEKRRDRRREKEEEINTYGYHTSHGHVYTYIRCM